VSIGLHHCNCQTCRTHAGGSTARYHRDINRFLATLDERHRRLFAGLLAERSGVTPTATITGLSRTTVLRGRRELPRVNAQTLKRVRIGGGGRKAREVENPALLIALDALLAEAAAGDPITGLKWTSKSLRKLTGALRRRGFRISTLTVWRLLRERGYALRVNRKRLVQRQVPERDAQFHYIAQERATFLRRKLPVLSVDAKKRELIGPFKNPGRAWSRGPRDVNMYDFPGLAAGVAIPYGIYDVGRDEGFIVVGTSHNTPAFATSAMALWWQHVGQAAYPGCRELLLEANGGSSNSRKARTWLLGLQHLADMTGLTITVTHYPPGTSKWNPVEHRLFSAISINWAGQPLDSYEKILKFLRTTKTGHGRRCRAILDRANYSLGAEPSSQELARLRLDRHDTFPAWNYTVSPNRNAIH